MTDNKDGMVLYGSVYRQFQNMLKRGKDQAALEFITAIMKYGFEGIEPPEDSDVWLYGFESSKVSIDNAAVRYAKAQDNGRKGGRPKKTVSKEEYYELEATLKTQGAIAKYLGMDEKTLRRIRAEWKEEEEQEKSGKTVFPELGETGKSFSQNRENRENGKNLNININTNITKKETVTETEQATPFDWLYDEVTSDGFIERKHEFLDRLCPDFDNCGRATKLNILCGMGFAPDEAKFIIDKILE